MDVSSLLPTSPAVIVFEALVVLGLIALVLSQRKKPAAPPPAPELVAQRLAAFEPVPLCPPLTQRAKQVLGDYVVLEGHPFSRCAVRGYKGTLVNLCSYDFLGLGEDPSLKKAVDQALSTFGFGSCGPRGFYGTISAHLDFEAAAAKFWGAPDSIMYSDSASAVSSAIPAFAGRKDLLVVDRACNESIMTGCKLSRSRVIFFEHNDVADLRRVLAEVQAEDKAQRGGKPLRRFIVTEGIYRDIGDICPLKAIVALKHEFKWRLFCDESLSFGVLGATGRGIVEHAGVGPGDVEIVVASMATALASVGGFCLSTLREVVDHQRLSGAGYCYSASAPPLFSCAAQAGLERIESDGPAMLGALRANARALRAALVESDGGPFEAVGEGGSDSPVLHVRLTEAHRVPGDALAEEAKLRAVCRAAREHGVLAVVANHIDQQLSVVNGQEQPAPPPPTIRLTVTARHLPADLEAAAKGLLAAAAEVLGKAGGGGSTSTSTSSGGNSGYSLRSRAKK